MIYVIEGPDRAGKSSFIESIRSKIANPSLLVIHSSRPPKSLDKDMMMSWTVQYYQQLIRTSIELADKGFDIILDRSWISECVYGPIYRDINIPQFMLESAIGGHESKFKICYLYDTAEALIAREDGESDARSIEDKSNELNSFVNAITNSIVKNVISINWADELFNKETLDYYASKLVQLP